VHRAGLDLDRDFVERGQRSEMLRDVDGFDADREEGYLAVDVRDNGAGILMLVMIIFAVLAPLFARLVQMAVSRQREFLADATSVRLTRNPLGLISALEKLAQSAEPFPGANRATQHLFIVNPFRNFTENAGALMATARFVLKTIPGIDRPAIITALPSVDGRTWVLDLGANIDSSASHMLQYAVMGAELVTAVEGIASPSVGLLNIGEEEIKGIESVKQAHVLLQESRLNYLGYIEGDDIYLKEGLDIVVADGFTGNIALKSSEGVAKMIRHFLNIEFKRNLLTRMAGLVALPVLRRLRKRIDPRRYNGASLLGLRGIVVKSHGGADEFAFETAIGIARKEVAADVAGRITETVAAQLQHKASA